MIDEIYRVFPKGFLRGISQDQIKRLELEIERGSTFPNKEVLHLAELAKRRGLKVACVSDTYFPEAHLRQILPFVPDYLITSCTYGAPKALGLHKALVSHSGIAPQLILHLGDNRDADLDAPSELGIATLWFPKFPPPWDVAIQEELPTSRVERAPMFKGLEGDGGLTSLRSQTPKYNREPHRSIPFLGCVGIGSHYGWIL